MQQCASSTNASNPSSRTHAYLFIDCANAVCAHKLDSTSSPLICCPSADFWNFNSLGPAYPYACASRLSDRCSSDRQCVRGACRPGINGNVCQLIEDGDSCNSDKDCWEETCARKNANPSSPKVCCPEGEYYEDAALFGSTNPFGCKVSLGDVCTQTDQCLYGECSGGTCQPVGDNGSCDDDSDCLQDVCAHQGTTSGTPLICCPGCAQCPDDCYVGDTSLGAYPWRCTACP